MLQTGGGLSLEALNIDVEVKTPMFKLTAGFPTSEAARLTGLTRRQLSYWDKRGIFKPSLVAARGRGRPRVYSFLDLVQLRVAKRLLDAGFSPRRLKDCMDYLRTYVSEAALASGSFVVAGGDALMLTDDPTVAVSIAKAGQMVWLIGLETVQKEVQDAAASLASA